MDCVDKDAMSVVDSDSAEVIALEEVLLREGLLADVSVVVPIGSRPVPVGRIPVGPMIPEPLEEAPVPMGLRVESPVAETLVGDVPGGFADGLPETTTADVPDAEGSAVDGSVVKVLVEVWVGEVGVDKSLGSVPEGEAPGEEAPRGAVPVGRNPVEKPEMMVPLARGLTAVEVGENEPPVGTPLKERPSTFVSCRL